MLQGSETSNLWSWLQPVLHAEPHIWAVINNYEPRLQRIGLHPTLEWAIALLWATLDVTYIPILLSLDPIIEPFLQLSKQGRDHLHMCVYVWTFALLHYKFRWFWSTCGVTNKLSSGQPQYVQYTMNEIGCEGLGAVFAVSLFVLAVLAGSVTFKTLMGDKAYGPLRVIIICLLSLAATCFCFYPLAMQLAGERFELRR